MGKNIRELCNAKVLLISSDKSIKGFVENGFSSYFKELKLSKGGQEAINLCVSNNFDLVVIDTDIEEYSFEKICEEISQKAPSLSKIIISDKENDDDIVTAVSNDAYTFIFKPFKEKDIKLAIIMCLNRTRRRDKLTFRNGIYFDEYRDQFFRSGNILIDFTKLEKSFLKLLIGQKGDIVSYNTIKDVVWKGKEMSIYTMRNIVNKIREKTYYQIIKNYSNKGYSIEKD